MYAVTYVEHLVAADEPRLIGDPERKTAGYEIILYTNKQDAVKRMNQIKKKEMESRKKLSFLTAEDLKEWKEWMDEQYKVIKVDVKDSWY